MGIKVEVVGHIQDIPCTCQLPWLAVDRVGTGWTTSHVVSTNRCVKIAPPLEGHHFCYSKKFFGQEEHFLVREP